jgi:hypothetical protein
MFLAKDLRLGHIWFIITLFFFFMPGNALPEITWFEKYYCDKIVHACFFALLAFLFIFPRRKDEEEMKNMWVMMILMTCFVYAIATEIIQHLFIPYRTGDVLDAAADAFGSLIVFLWFRFHNYEEILWYIDGDAIITKPQFVKKG